MKNQNIQNKRNYGRELIVSLKQIVKAEHIEDMMFACEIKGGMEASFARPAKPHCHIMMQIDSGTLEMIVNGKAFSFAACQFINMPDWAEISGLRYSSDFHGTIVAVEETIIKDIFQNRNPLSNEFKGVIGYTLATEILSPKEKDKIWKDMQNLLEAISDKEHTFVEEISYAYFYILITDISDIFCRRHGDGLAVHTNDMRRASGLLKSFMELLSENVESRCDVEFYAEKLCISKQYLAAIVKEKTNASVSRIIASVRVQKAAALLRDPELTIEQVASRLSFSDRSSFGKFFRKHTGTTPLEYRRSLKRTLLSMRPENLLPGTYANGLAK